MQVPSVMWGYSLSPSCIKKTIASSMCALYSCLVLLSATVFCCLSHAIYLSQRGVERFIASGVLGPLRGHQGHSQRGTGATRVASADAIPLIISSLPRLAWVRIQTVPATRPLMHDTQVRRSTWPRIMKTSCSPPTI